MLIYKILTASDRAELEAGDAFAGAPVDKADGYIHFSTAEQLADTLEKHFQTDAPLWIAATQTDRLGANLKWEPARGGALFPHLYAALRSTDILWIAPVPIGPDGRRTLPELETGAPRADAAT